jgi:uncharacterized protein YeeX (DUF496 family)
MADIVTLLREIMTLTSSVGALRADVDRLAEKVEKHTERIIKLENREELLTEKMTNSAIKAVFDMTAQYFDRLSAIEKKLPSVLPPPSLPPATEGS